MGVNPKIGILPPKWMVKIMENPIKMDDLGVKTLFLETPMFWFCCLPYPWRIHEYMVHLPTNEYLP